VILDTNAFSAFVDGATDLARLLTEPFAIPVIVLGEYRFGIQQSRRRSDHERWLNENLRFHRVLPVSDVTTLYYADIRVELKKAGSPIPANDVWIAALCRQHSMPVLSRDRHFDAVDKVRRIVW
jgi:predicted nucleic acid-binding protein